MTTPSPSPPPLEAAGPGAEGGTSTTPPPASPPPLLQPTATDSTHTQALASSSSPPPSPIPEDLEYSALLHNVEAAVRRAQEGAKACKATGALLMQHAALEEAHGAAVVHVGDGFAALKEPSAPTISKAIAATAMAVQGMGKQHLALAQTIQQDVGRTTAAFAERQAEAVKRMVGEVQAAQDDLARGRTQHRKVKDKYRRACREAETVLKKGLALLPPSQQPTTNNTASADQQPPSAGVSPSSSPVPGDGTPIDMSSPPAAPARLEGGGLHHHRQESAALAVSASSATNSSSIWSSLFSQLNSGTTTATATPPAPTMAVAAAGVAATSSLSMIVSSTGTGGSSSTITTKPALLKLQDKAGDALADLKAVEADYLASKRALELKEAMLQRAIKEHLTRFQVNEEARASFIKQKLQALGAARRTMLDRLDAALAALAETVKAINARQDLLAYTQQVASPPAPAPATPSPGSSTGSSSGSSRPLSPFAAAVASPTGGDGEGMDEAAALKAKTAPGIEHMEKCIKTLRAMCHCISELATAEEGYAKATLKLVKKSGYHPNPPTNASSASYSSDTTTAAAAASSSSSSHGGFRRCMEREGPSVRAAWQGYMAAQARIGAIHAGTAARLATSACVLLAQTQDELSGTRQEILVTAAASTKALAAARAVYAKARGKSEGKSKELADRSQELRAVSAAATLAGEGDGGGGGGGGGAAELKQQQKLEAKVGVLREKAAATDAAREAAEDALAAQRAQIVAQAEVILQALSSREEERIGKTRLALLALCQAGSAALADTRAEEAVRGGLIDAIDVEADLRAFVAETLSGDGATAAAATTATTAEAAPEHHPNHHHHHPHRRAESPPATALLAAAAAQQQLLQLGQTLQGAALAEKLDLLAKEGPRAVVALAAPPVSTSPAPAVDATTIVSPLASPPALAASVSVSVSASGAGLGGGGTRASTSSKRLEYYSCRYPEGTPAAVLAAASGAAITDSSSVGTTTTTTLTESSGVGGGTGTGGGADSPPPGPMRHRSVNLSMGSIDLGFNSDDEEKGGGGGEGDARSKKKKQRPAVRFVAASISRELSASVNSIPLHTTRLPESMSPRPDTLGSSASFILHFNDDGTDPEQEQEQQQQLAHEEGYEESEGICGGGAEGHPAPESPDRYFSVRYPAGVDVAALLAAAGNSGSGSLLGTGSSSSPTILEAPEGEGQEENGEATAATTAREPASAPAPTGTGTIATTAASASASASASATEQDLDPLVAEDIRPFNLPAGERVIESYSCALLPTSLLIHGRLYVTPRFVCFGSWGATRLVLPMEDISFIEKANTMGIVPNALWVVMRSTGNRYYFSSFLYRDDCFDRIFALLPKRLKDPIPDLRPLLQQQQQRAHERARAATAGEEDGGEGAGGGGGGKKAVSFGPDVVAGSDEQHRASVGGGGRRTNKKVTPLGVGNGLEGGEKGEATTPLPPAPAAASPRPLPPLSLSDDGPVARMSLMTDEELPCGVGRFLRAFWGEGSRFYEEYLTERGDKEVSVGPWTPKEEQDAYSGEAFHRVRDVFYSRVRDGRGIGPKTVPTREVQMFRFHDPAQPEDRLFISTALTFQGVPYGDCFHVQTRWVLTRVGTTGKRCRLQIGLEVVFRQTVFLKAAITAATAAETKKTLGDWLTRAKAHLLAISGTPSPGRGLLLPAGAAASTAAALEGDADGGSGSKEEGALDAGAAAATGAGALTISAPADHGSAAAGSAGECALCRLVGGGRHKGGRGLDGTALLLLLLLLLVLVLLGLVALLVVRVDALAAQITSLLQAQRAQGGMMTGV